MLDVSKGLALGPLWMATCDICGRQRDIRHRVIAGLLEETHGDAVDELIGAGWLIIKRSPTYGAICGECAKDIYGNRPKEISAGLLPEAGWLRQEA